MTIVARLALACATAAASAVLVAIALAPPAEAHAGFVSSDPVDGAVLATAPVSVTLTFTERPDATLSTIAVLDAAGRDVVEGDPEAADGASLAARLPAGLPDGGYVVSWRIISAVDGHVSAGGLSFGVGSPAPGVQGAPPVTYGPTVVSVAGKALLYAGSFMVLAVAVVGLGVFRGRPARLHVVALAGSLAACTGASGVVVAQQRGAEVSVIALLRADAGRPLTALLAATFVALAFAILATARPSWRRLLWVAGAAAAAAMLARAWGGHAAAAAPAGLRVATQWIHFMAVAVWIGGLVLLVFVLRGRTATSGDTDVPLIRRYSAVALGAVVVVIATGSLRAIAETGGIGALGRTLGTSYGRVLAVKVVVACIVIALGALNRFRSIPRLAAAGDGGMLRRLAGTEVVLAAGIVLLTGTLTGLNPRPGVTSVPTQQTSVVATGTNFARTVAIELQLSPGFPGSNVVTLRVLDPDTGEVSTPDAVTLRLTSVTRPEVAARDLDLTPGPGETWNATTPAFALAGTWDVDVSVRTGVKTDRLQINVATRPDVIQQTADMTPGAPTLHTVTYRDGTSAQVFVDPGDPGTNQVHVTFFNADGFGLPMDDIVVVAFGPGEPARVLTAQPFGDGHVVAMGAFGEGQWTVDVVGVGEGGDARQVTIVETVEP